MSKFPIVPTTSPCKGPVPKRKATASNSTSWWSRKSSAYRFGRWAEVLARWWMRCRGYRIVAVNFRIRGGEIDLIARRGRCLAIVEIKARSDSFALEWALTSRQKRRIEHASAVFISRNPQLAHLDIRFDLVLVHRWIRHITDAWRPSCPPW